MWNYVSWYIEVDVYVCVCVPLFICENVFRIIQSHRNLTILHIMSNNNITLLKRSQITIQRKSVLQNMLEI